MKTRIALLLAPDPHPEELLRLLDGLLLTMYEPGNQGCVMIADYVRSHLPTNTAVNRSSVRAAPLGR